VESWLPAESFSCPWCPTVVVTVESPDAARNWMEAHLDGHFAHAIGRPVPGVAA
jgi:hypothetical protein